MPKARGQENAAEVIAKNWDRGTARPGTWGAADTPLLRIVYCIEDSWDQQSTSWSNLSVGGKAFSSIEGEHLIGKKLIGRYYNKECHVHPR
jgi:hypothetical protein